MPLDVKNPERHITLITIDNPAKRNAMTRADLTALAALWDQLDKSVDCRAVIIRGVGDRAFCAGADIGGDLSASPEMSASINRALLKTSQFSKPVIAAVNGDCAGGGIELLISTDIRFAAPHARFGLPEVRFAIYPFGGAAVKLVQQIGHVHALDLLLTGRLVPADHAQKIGLINEIVPAGELISAVLARARLIAANSPHAVQAVKTQISSMAADHAQSREALDQLLGDKVRASPDFQEGITAFKEKRQASYE